MVLNESLATLIIPTFNGSYGGTYTCGNNNDMDRTTAKSFINLLLAVKPGKLCMYINFFILKLDYCVLLCSNY